MEEKSHTLAFRQRLWTLLPQQHSHSVAHFRAVEFPTGWNKEYVDANREFSLK
jgi:hypothetical protein